MRQSQGASHRVPRSATAKYRDIQLVKTIRRAWRFSPYYRELLANCVHRVRGTADLECVPILSKEDLAANCFEMLTEAELPTRVGLSSGTSYGDVAKSTNDSDLLSNLSAPAILFQGTEELKAIHYLHARLLSEPIDSDELTLAINNGVHGTSSIPIPSAITIPLSKPFHLAVIRRFLTTQLPFGSHKRRITRLVGSLNQMLAFASYLDQHPANDLALRSIAVYGTYLGQRQREHLEGIFHCPILNYYGISEIAGAVAEECVVCRGFHFPPIVVPEVIDLVHLKPTKGDFGELLLTGLLPYCSIQPILRLRTGDLVQVVRDCPVDKDISVRPMGRISRSLVHPNLGILFPSFLGREVIDSVDVVARDTTAQLTALCLSSTFGPPRYDVKLDMLEGSEAMELKVRFETEAIDSISSIKHIRDSLLRITADAAAAFACGKYDVTVTALPINSLSSLALDYKW